MEIFFARLAVRCPGFSRFGRDTLKRGHRTRLLAGETPALLFGLLAFANGNGSKPGRGGTPGMQDERQQGRCEQGQGGDGLGHRIKQTLRAADGAIALDRGEPEDVLHGGEAVQVA